MKVKMSGYRSLKDQLKQSLHDVDVDDEEKSYLSNNDPGGHRTKPKHTNLRNYDGSAKFVILHSVHFKR